MADATAFGTKLKIDISSTLTLVVSVTEVAFPKTSKVIDEITAHDSPSGYYEALDVGVKRAEPFDVTVVWDSAQTTHAKFVTAFDGTSAVNFSVEDPGGVEIMAFAGHVESIERMTPLKGALRAKMHIHPTGAATIT